MRLWRLFIYFTLLNAYFICVETLKGIDGKFENLKIDKVKPKELKLEAETKRNVRTKRGAVTKYVVIPLLATAGIVSGLIGLSILLPLIVTPGFIIGFAGAAFFGGIAWLCLITIRNLANKEKNVSYEKEGHYYHEKDSKGNLVKHEVKRIVKRRRSYTSGRSHSRRRSNTYEEIRNSKKVKTRRVKTYRKRSETIVDVIEVDD
uniref:Uncharacterized protein n=1 Tax=Meloidogyne javanica TaxID=6303 RepID=A0A915MYA8_MELJA